MYIIVIRQLYKLPSVPSDNSSTPLAPCIVITILLTVFPVLYFISLRLFCNYQFVLLNSFTFSTIPHPLLFLSSVHVYSFFCGGLSVVGCLRCVVRGRLSVVGCLWWVVCGGLSFTKMATIVLPIMSSLRALPFSH